MEEPDAPPNQTSIPKACRLQRYRESHAANPASGQASRQASDADFRIQFEPDPPTSTIKDWADILNLPTSAVRGVGSYYADLGGPDPSTVHVCHGTSCCLLGGTEPNPMTAASPHPAHKVYCLGYCDRSPVSMQGDKLHYGGAPTRIRNAAPEAIVTGRILKDAIPKIADAMARGVYQGLSESLQRAPAELLDEVEHSGIRGRGGAGFSAGRKWKTAAGTPATKRYVIANGDEGDPGSFIDRVLMEQDPHSIIEGMILCAHAIGADEGIAYIRSEYPQAIRIMKDAIEDARREGFLGENICGSGMPFDLRVFTGMGSYVCGEETALIRSLEGLRGEVRMRPPYPARQGLYGKPTVVNNVETLLNIPYIIHRGNDAYHELGTSATSGTKAVCLNRGFAHPGIVEIEFGTTFRQVIEEHGGGGRDGRALAAVLVGGPMGSLLLPSDWDVPICLEHLHQHDIQFGHGGFVAIPDDGDFRGLLDHCIEFMVAESCGKCAPCRLGSQSLHNALHHHRPRPELEDMLDAIEAGSLCAFGQFTPGPIRTLIQQFGDRIFSPEASA